MSGFYRDNSYDAELKVGTYDGGYHIGRSFMHFDTAPFAWATVQHAEMHLAERHSWNCGYAPEPAYRVTGGWNGRNMPDWSNQPPVDPNWVGGSWDGTTCGARTAKWNVTGMAAMWAAAGQPEASVSLRATNESDNNRWKKYASTEAGAPPALHVWYTPPPPPNTPPANVWALYPTNGARVLSSTTTASAYYADANGTAGQILFGVWDASSTLLWAAWSGSVCNYCQGSVTLPYLADGWYQVGAIGHDGQAYSPAWTGPLWYFVDARSPNPPTSLTPATGAVIAAPSRATAVYSEPYGWAGHMYFWLLNGAGTTLKEGWDDATMAGRTTANGGTASFALPALAIGTYSLYAAGYDGALSPQVGPNTFTVAAAPGAPSGINPTSGPSGALLKWTAAAGNGSSVMRYDFTAYDGASAAAHGAVRTRALRATASCSTA